MKVLLIDNNILPEYWGAQDLRRSLLADSGVDVTVVRGPHADLPPVSKHFERVVISGSKTSAMEEASWITALEKWIRGAVDANIPILGVCYGHQMIARALSGMSTVGLSKVPEFGWTAIQKTGSSKLLEGLPNDFYSFSAHFDEVCEIPSKDFVITAKSQACAIQAMEHRSKAIFGIQFHPERNSEDGDASLASRKKTMSKAKRGLRHNANAPQAFKLLNEGKGKRLFQKEVGAQIFKNFLLLK